MLKRGNAFDCSPRATRSISISTSTSSGAGRSSHGSPGPANAGMRTDTHLPYTVLVQRWRWSTLGRRVTGGGHFQVRVGAAAPGETFFRAYWHSVSGCLLLPLPLLLLLDATGSERGSFCRCKVQSLCGGLRIRTARWYPASWCGVTNSPFTNATQSQTVWGALQVVKSRRALQPTGTLPVWCCVPACMHVYKDGSAHEMRFPETPQDQCLLHWLSETSSQELARDNLCEKTGFSVTEMLCKEGEESRISRLRYYWKIPIGALVVVLINWLLCHQKSNSWSKEGQFQPDRPLLPG